VNTSRSEEEKGMTAHTHIYVWDRLVLSAGPGREASSHRHFGAIVLLAPREPLTLVSRDSSPVVTQAAVVAPNAWHRAEACSAGVVTILVGPDHPWFCYVKPLLSGQPIVSLELSRLGLQDVDWPDLFEGRSECAAARQLVLRILQAFGGADAQPHALDARVGDVVQMLREGSGDTPTPDELGRRVGLSGYTLMRRFKSELGVRIREYVLWRRLMFALTLVDGHRTVAEIAQRTGFYDQAHLTRTARRMVELAPSFINDFSQTRVHVCPHVA
jgi:AraC-like DNA-binding protein